MPGENILLVQFLVDQGGRSCSRYGELGLVMAWDRGISLNSSGPEGSVTLWLSTRCLLLLLVRGPDHQRLPA